MKTIFLVSLFVCLTARAEEYKGIRGLDLHVAQGSVKILGVEGDKATVAVSNKHLDKSCVLTMEQRGDLLFVELINKTLFSAHCEANFDLQVPKAIVAKLKVGNGDISVAKTTGPFDVDSGMGNVSVLAAKLPAFEARLGSGSLRAEGLEASATVRSGMGNVRLVYSKVPGQGEVMIESGTGDAVVLFPQHSKVKTSFTSGMGSLTNRLGDSPAAAFNVSMKAGMGNLEVGTF
jgi:hypothetical protein